MNKTTISSKRRTIFSIVVLCVLISGIFLSSAQVQERQKIDTHAQSVAQASVSILNASYSPQVIYVVPGTAVTWTNESTGQISHTTTSASQTGPEVWDSGVLAPGQSFSHTFTTLGSYPYEDTVFPYITGTVVVTTNIPLLTQQIVIQNNLYTPQTLTVYPGTTVTWINEDLASHSATSNSQTAAENWDSGILKPGQSFTRVFNFPGTYPYHDTLNPTTVTGTITVSSLGVFPTGVAPSGTTPDNLSPTSSQATTAPSPSQAPTSIPPTPTIGIPITDTPAPAGQGGYVPNPDDMQIQVSVKIPGIGINGNPSPKHLTRSVAVNVYATTSGNNTSSSTTPTATGNGFLIYDKTNYFSGVLHLGNIPNGTYYMTVHVPYTLSTYVLPLFQSLSTSQLNVMPPVTVIPGDIDNNDSLNITDYNLFVTDILACVNQPNCQYLPLIDLNDDGVADATDYNILLQSFSEVYGN